METEFHRVTVVWPWLVTSPVRLSLTDPLCRRDGRHCQLESMWKCIAKGPGRLWQASVPCGVAWTMRPLDCYVTSSRTVPQRRRLCRAERAKVLWVQILTPTYWLCFPTPWAVSPHSGLAASLGEVMRWWLVRTWCPHLIAGSQHIRAVTSDRCVLSTIMTPECARSPGATLSGQTTCFTNKTCSPGHRVHLANSQEHGELCVDWSSLLPFNLGWVQPRRGSCVILTTPRALLSACLSFPPWGFQPDSLNKSHQECANSSPPSLAQIWAQLCVRTSCK
jgi:hypothetical protein